MKKTATNKTEAKRTGINKKNAADRTLKMITSILEEKKAVDIKVLNVKGNSDLWDYFVVCSGLSSVHVRTLYDNLEDGMAKQGQLLAHRDTGIDNKWIILDYGDILVHILDSESRQYYSIEKMWGEREELSGSFLKRMKKTIKAKKERVRHAKKRKK
jgi:ribosome-associated protein